MEYLQQAQERLRQQAGSAGPGTIRPEDHSVTQAPPLIYSSTRAITLSEQLMRDQRLISGHAEGPFVDAYKRLRAQVMQQFRQKEWNVLGISSPTAHEGKTLTAVNLSLALAMDLAHTVMLVDADMHRPSVHRLFGLDQAQGLTEYLFDQVPLTQLLIHPGVGRLVFLPGGRSIKNSSEALASPRMAALAQELKHRYPSRFIVLDLPPILSRADVLGFSSHIDALLLVIEEGRTSSVEVEQAMTAIAGTVPILGGVLNKSGRTQLTKRRAMGLLHSHSA